MADSITPQSALSAVLSEVGVERSRWLGGNDITLKEMQHSH